MRAFFRAAAAFARMAPWRDVPGDEALVVHIPDLGIEAMAVAVVAGEDVRGFAIFEDVAAFLEVIDGGADDEGGDEPARREAVPHLAVHLAPRDELPPGLAAEIAEHGWEVVDDRVVPRPVALDEDGEARPFTSDELLVAEAVALAVAALVASTPDLAQAWQDGEPIARTIVVGTHRGPLAVTLGAPAGAVSVAGSSAPLVGVLAELAGLEETGDDLDPGRVAELSLQLIAELRASPEGRALPEGPSFCKPFLDLAVRAYDATVVSIGPEELTEILLELFPRKVVVPAQLAPAIVEELRALYRYLDRAHGLEQASDCLRVLGPDVEGRLAAALAPAATFRPKAKGRSPKRR